MDANEARILKGLAFLALVMIAIGAMSLIPNRSNERDTRATRNAPLTRVAQTRAVMRPSGSTFETVRNDCGLCGTNSVVGGWESEDGRMLILNSDGSFMGNSDDGPLFGDYTVSGGKLCLILATGAKGCFAYTQKVDAMKLDDAIYIRK